MHNYPLLQRVLELYSEVELGNVLLLASQHLLEPQKHMFEHLIRMGLKPKNCVIVGKNYSTNREVMFDLVASGCVIAPFSDEFDPTQPFDVWFAEKLTEFVKTEITKRPMETYSKVIILDDGGFMHLVVNKLCPNLRNVVGIEQTSSGHHRIKAAEINFPSVSVARSYNKLQYESPYIGRNGEERIVQYMRRNSIRNPRVLVMGLGPIGRQIAGKLLLMRQFDGQVIDPKLDQLRFGRLDPASKGMLDFLEEKHVIRPEKLKHRIGEFDLIIGNTGTSVLTENDIELLHPEATLISMSSSDREFPALPFRRRNGKVHDDYKRNGRTLVNGGFPITFDSKPHGMPPQQIEFTIALLMIQLVNQVAPLHPLAYVVEQIRHMWRPDEGAETWYETLNSLD